MRSNLESNNNIQYTGNIKDRTIFQNFTKKKIKRLFKKEKI